MAIIEQLVVRAGMLGRRGYALESVAARICREAGGRVRTNMFIRDMDLDVPVSDGRRLEVVVDGIPLHGGAQLVVDTTLVCTLFADGRHDEEQRARMGSRCGAFIGVPSYLVPQRGGHVSAGPPRIPTI